MNLSLISIITSIGASGVLAYVWSLQIKSSTYKLLWIKEKELNQERDKKMLEDKIKFLESEVARLKPYQNYHHQMLNRINYLINQKHI